MPAAPWELRANTSDPSNARCEQRVEVGCKTGDLVTLEVRDPERPAVRRRPDRLHHVPEVEAAGLERLVPEAREGGEPGRVGGDARPEQDARTCHAATCSSS